MSNWEVKKVSKIPDSKFGGNTGKVSKYDELYRNFRRELFHDPEGNFGYEFQTVQKATKAIAALRKLAEYREANNSNKMQFALRGSEVYAFLKPKED